MMRRRSRPFRFGALVIRVPRMAAPAACTMALTTLIPPAASRADTQDPAPATRTVCGVVRKVTCDMKRGGTTTIELKPRSKEGAVTIRAADRLNFTPRPEDQYRGTDICATGHVDTDGGRRVVIVGGPQEVEIRKRFAPPPAPWNSPYFTPCDEGLVVPELRKEVKPSYTRSAVAARIEGTVGLEAMIGTDGGIGEIRVVKSLDATYGLDAEAVRAIRQWEFTPGMKDGQPVPVVVDIEMSFKLR